MPNLTSNAITQAANDSDLLTRFVAMGATIGIDPQQIEAARTKLAAAPVDDQGNYVATLHDSAVADYRPAPRPGQDPARVRDDQLVAALRHVFPAPAPSA